MKYLLLIPAILLLLLAAYIFNYYRLSITYPRFQFDAQEFERNLESSHSHHETGNEFDPKNVDVARTMIRVTSEIPEMGTHWLSIPRYFDGFDPKKPDGVLTWRGKVVAYQYYSPTPFGGYNWHRHTNMCGLENLVIRYGWSLAHCLSEGGIPQLWFMNQYMLHVWVDDNPMGVNALWNPNLKP